MAAAEIEQEPPIQLCSNNPSVLKFNEKSRWANERRCHPYAPKGNSPQTKNLVCKTGILSSIYWTADDKRLKNVSLVCDDFRDVLHAEIPKSQRERGYSKPHAGLYKGLNLNKGDVFKPVMGNEGIPIGIEHIAEGCPGGTELTGMTVNYDASGEITDVQPICGASLIPTMCDQMFGKCAEELENHIGNPHIRSYLKKKCGDEPSVEICKKHAQLLAAKDETSSINKTGVNLTEKSISSSNEELKTLKTTTTTNNSTTSTTTSNEPEPKSWRTLMLVILGFLVLIIIAAIIIAIISLRRKGEDAPVGKNI
jgi:hypothetical protein